MSNVFSDAEATQGVIRAEREWLEAHLRLDVVALARLMGDEYQQTNDRDELLGKQQVLASFGWLQPVSSNPSLERTSQRPLRALWPTAHVER
jgi:hypothetical protein